jgi:hypothetical protein
VTVSPAVVASYCSQQVQALLATNASQQIDARTAIAGSGQTGYTLMNGQGVMNAAGLSSLFGNTGSSSSSSSSGSITGTMTGGYMKMSCIDRLFNGGPSLIFNPPNLSSILNMLQNLVCAEANQMFSQLMQPISQALGQASAMGGSSMLGGGGFFPGLSLASLGGGINSGVNNGGGISIGIAGVGQVGTSSTTSILSGDGSFFAQPLPSGNAGCQFPGLFAGGSSYCAGTTGTASSSSSSTNNSTMFGNPGTDSVASSGFVSQYSGQCVGSGQCVALVQSATGVGNTSTWSEGQSVQGANIPVGTAIATFDQSGTYANATDGSSHAAIYLGQDANGIQVLDQWSGHAASVRTLPFSNSGSAANNGSAFYVINSK